MKIEDVKEIRKELDAFKEILGDIEKRLKLEGEMYNCSYISGTKETSALKSYYRVLKYKLDKLILPNRS